MSGDVVVRLRELYRGAVEEDDGWPVNRHDACVRLGARFREVLPALFDVVEAAQRVPYYVSVPADLQPLRDALARLEALP